MCILGIHSNFLLIKQNSSAFLEIFFKNYQKIVFSSIYFVCMELLYPFFAAYITSLGAASVCLLLDVSRKKKCGKMSFAVKYSMHNCNNYYSMQFES